MGCKEALFTLGEKPELRYKAAREALAEMGYASTTEYLLAAAEAVFKETGLLPHLNPGNLSPEELSELRRVSPSMGIMLESASERLCQKGMPHYGSPDKDPARRLQTLELAGQAAVPFTSGILIAVSAISIGIGDRIVGEWWNARNMTFWAEAVILGPVLSKEWAASRSNVVG